MSNQVEHITHLKRLPLHAEHERFGARFGAFGEWYVPLYYTSVLEEHEIVRRGVGVFDISHMGEVYLAGPDAGRALNRLITNDLSKLEPGQALYSPVSRESGGIVDDVIVYECSSVRFLIVVNAANIEKDLAWFESHLEGQAQLHNVSSDTALLAVQGPKSRNVIQALFNVDLTELSYYHFMQFKSPFGEILLAQTGYTGEEGFEIFCSVGEVSGIWKRLFEVGTPVGLKPIGFGARDTLRLEAKFLLYGHDLNDETTPLEAGLSWTIGWLKDDFIGKQALELERSRGSKRRLIGFELKERGIAREGCPVFVDGRSVGTVTSGTFSPTLKRSIGLAYVPVEFAKAGQVIHLAIRGKSQKAHVVKTPFYRRTPPRNNAKNRGLA